MSVLAEIVERKRVEVAARAAADPLDIWRSTLSPSNRRFEPDGSTAFILECKRASPSEGILRTSLDPESLARTYAPFATAISVLTDGPWFRGSFDDLRRVRETVHVPVLCKDFMVTPYQIYEARRHGADIVLLMLSVVTDQDWIEMAAVARDLSLDVLTEVHDDAELARARSLGATLIGINNRDLKSLQVDLQVSEVLGPHVPAGVHKISESGLSNRRQVRRLRGAGFDGFLVGSVLMKSASIEQAVRQLIFGNVKVCGLRSAVAAAEAWAAGATWGGLIFAPSSPRRIDLEAARELFRVPLRWAGVFVDQPLDTVVEAARTLDLAAVQLHGDETEDYVAQLREQIKGEIWKVYRISDRLPASLPAHIDRVLFDTWQKGRHGGTGLRWDWSLLHQCRYRDRVILSGGLTPETAGLADATDVWALDVNSGVETAPGVKSPSLLKAFFAAIRRA